MRTTCSSTASAASTRIVYPLTLQVLDALPDDRYARIVDSRWDPPVTAAARLVSVVTDITQVGKGAYPAG